MATDRNVYVDTGATGAGDGTSWTDAYVTLTLAEAAEQGDYTAATGSDENVFYHCRSTGGADTSATVIDGSTTDATHQINIIGDGTYTRVITDDINIYPRDNHGSIENISLTVTGLTTSTRHGIFILPTAASDWTLNRLDVIGDVGIYAPQGIVASNSNLVAHVYNCIVRGWLNSGGFGIKLLNGTSDVRNCVVRGNYNGVQADTVINCAVADNTDDFYSATTVDYCASDDGDGTNAVTPADWSAVFVDYTNHDYHLKSTDTDLTGAGSDQSAYYTTDKEYTAWGATYDIGAFVAPAATGGTLAGSLALMGVGI